MAETPLYVYGVTRAGAEPGDLAGVDGEPIRTVTERDVAAFVSAAPPGAVETTRARLLTHARVLELLAADRTVLPMRFGVVAPSERVLRESVLGPRRKVFLSLLKRFEGAVEVDLRVLFDEGEALKGSARVGEGGARGHREAARAAPARARARRAVGHGARGGGRRGGDGGSGRDPESSARRPARLRAR